jgi:hypothetical protein
VQKSRKIIRCLQNGSDWKFRQLSYENIPGSGEEGLASSGRSFLLGILLPTLF